ncbi:hypothetical protein [Streptomyces sp. NPDC048256]|uniref:hypothetical protein n=1 Tax=unclassified Streptomyces TaxID=2593676 RepID=UPI0033F6EE7F
MTGGFAALSGRGGEPVRRDRLATPHLGATQVAAGAQLSAGAAARGRAVLVGGLPGLVSWREDGSALSVMAFTVADGRITGIAITVDPARLAAMNLPEPE